jgi:hypothetical protein
MMDELIAILTAVHFDLKLAKLWALYSEMSDVPDS